MNALGKFVAFTLAIPLVLLFIALLLFARIWCNEQ